MHHIKKLQNSSSFVRSYVLDMANTIALIPRFFIMLHIITCLSCIRAHKHHRSQSSTWAKTLAYGHQHNKTSLQFYYHVIVSGSSPTSFQIAKAPISYTSKTGFGILDIADEPLTVGPDLGSKLVGRAQGLYGVASQAEESLIMAMSFTFSDGIYNGSSLSIFGRNSIVPVGEMAVVGGTGVFRMARGYAVHQTYRYNATSGDAIVGYSVTVVHS